ncbi:hypothetical protein AMS60_10645 [Bacillus sp. FJAT-21945]|nr:hypothetical protein AMS60_10645 [Bacillus sp. FJAT-21945]
MLKGVRIIDFSNYLPGPYATMRLAELGAEVIKVEPIEGDPARHLGIKKDDTGIVFLANNRQKKSIALNLKEKEGIELALKLIETADAVLESFRPGVMKKLGLDYETVASIMGNHLLIAQETDDQTGIKELNGVLVSYAMYETKDHRYVTLGALEQKFWLNFCQALGRVEWINAHFSKAETNNPVFMQVCELFRSRELTEWMEFGKIVDCCLTPVLEANELHSFAYFQEKEILWENNNESMYVKMHRDQKQNGASSPALGQNTEELVAELIRKASE